MPAWATWRRCWRRHRSTCWPAWTTWLPTRAASASGSRGSTGPSSSGRPNLRQRIRPAAVVTLDERARRHDELTASGEDAYRRGAVAILVVAGGEGTRLGFDGPKGLFPLGPALAQVDLPAPGREGGEPVTACRSRGSAARADEPEDGRGDARVLRAHDDRFGLADGQLSFFAQGTVPSLDQNARALLAAPGVLLENPDGHGGVFAALVESGELDRLSEQCRAARLRAGRQRARARRRSGARRPRARGAYGRGDEGAREDASRRARRAPRDGRYARPWSSTPSPRPSRRARTDTGELIYRWGSPAMHAWSVDFLSRLADRGHRLPLHRSAKLLQAWINGAVREVDGWKFERFVFDLHPRRRAERRPRGRSRRRVRAGEERGGEDRLRDGGRARAPLRRMARGRGVHVDLRVGELIEISPLLAATRAQFLELTAARAGSPAGRT